MTDKQIEETETPAATEAAEVQAVAAETTIPEKAIEAVESKGSEEASEIVESADFEEADDTVFAGKVPNPSLKSWGLVLMTLGAAGLLVFTLLLEFVLGRLQLAAGIEDSVNRLPLAVVTQGMLVLGSILFLVGCIVHAIRVEGTAIRSGMLNVKY